MHSVRLAAAMAGLLIFAAPAFADVRQTLQAAAFSATTADEAKRDVAAALAESGAALARNGADQDAQFTQALGIGYRAKLFRSAADAKQAKRQFDAYLASHPRDPEAALAIAGWNLDSVNDLGGMMARIGLGASKAAGLAALDRAVALGGGQARIGAFAALLRARIDPADPLVARLVRASLAAPAPTSLDKLMQRRAALLLKPIATGDASAISATARRLLPFGAFAS